jgi:MYXO-CTERM domain-containing protein
VAESCDGAAPRCPPDEVQGAGTICRPASGACDLDDACDGTSTECAADRVRPRGFICRAASGACDVAEACDGAHPLCSIDRHRVDGSSCDDALLCNGQSACEAGECVEGEPLACEPGTECIEVLGECQAPVPAGCGCSAPGSRRAPALAVVGLLGLLGLLRRRR